MRRSIILTTVLAVTTAVFSACDPKPEVPNKPASTPAPVSTTTPAPATPAPTGSPSTTPAKPIMTPVKEGDKNVNKEVKPKATEAPKAN